MIIMFKPVRQHGLSLVRTGIITTFVIIFACCSNDYANAQDTATRPRVGLALSGGASHGIAHLGVLKVMEEAGLRPDCITGVSMGSIVGGMYAIGYSVDSIENILKSINWDLLLGNKIPENRIIFQEKKHFYNSIITLPVSFKKKVQLPSGLINGQQMENMLSYYAWPAADISDYSKLPIPFLCMGSDIVSGNKIVLKSGYLPEALRASSAIPSVFSPFTIDTCVLVDGGLFRNIAISEARDMGADILIGSYTGFYPLTESELQSVDGLIKQIGLLTSYKDFDDQKNLIDILIEPNTKGIPMSDFFRVDSLIERGYKAALPFRETFRKLADSLDKIAPPEPLDVITDKQYYRFDKIEVTGNEINTEKQILGILNINPGERVDKSRLTEAIELLYGKALFEKVSYRITPRNDSLFLTINCIERPRAMLFGAAHYDNTLESGLIIGFSGMNLVTRKSAINVETYIGRNYRLRANVIQFVDRNQKYGLSADYFLEKTPLPIITMEGESGKMFSRNYYGGISLNSRIGLNHMMKLTEEVENLGLFPDFITGNGLKKISYRYLTSSFEYLANTLDNKHFPNTGVAYSILLKSSKLISGSLRSDSLDASNTSGEAAGFSFNRFHTIRGSFRSYFSANKKTTFGVRIEGLYIANPDSIKAQNSFFLLGGSEAITRRSIPMTGFHSNEIPVRSVLEIGTDADIEFNKDFHISLAGNVAVIQEAERETGFSLLLGYGIGASYMTVAGPLGVGLMHGIYKNEIHFSQIKGYISFGYNF